jgi:hypothetical protein
MCDSNTITACNYMNEIRDPMDDNHSDIYI